MTRWGVFTQHLERHATVFEVRVRHSGRGNGRMSRREVRAVALAVFAQARRGHQQVVAARHSRRDRFGCACPRGRARRTAPYETRGRRQGSPREGQHDGEDGEPNHSAMHSTQNHGIHYSSGVPRTEGLTSPQSKRNHHALFCCCH